MVKKHCTQDFTNDGWSRRMMYLPIVDSSTTMNLMYMIKMEELKDYCELYFGFVDDNPDTPGIGIPLTKIESRSSPMKLPNPKNIQ